MRALERLGRVQLSKSFFMRDMLYSEIGNFYGIPNIPVYPGTAIKTGQQLCEELLEPLQDKFGRISIRSAYRSPTINAYGSKNELGCMRNSKNYARHIWDHPDENGHYGAMATIWQAMAWYIHDHLPYSSLVFYPKLGAFNIGWHQNPKRDIKGFTKPRGYLTKPDMDNHGGDHSAEYLDLLNQIA